MRETNEATFYAATVLALMPAVAFSFTAALRRTRPPQGQGGARSGAGGHHNPAGGTPGAHPTGAHASRPGRRSGPPGGQ